ALCMTESGMVRNETFQPIASAIKSIARLLWRRECFIFQEYTIFIPSSSGQDGIAGDSLLDKSTKTPRRLLIAARKERLWSQQELASLLGTTQHNISRW